MDYEEFLNWILGLSTGDVQPQDPPPQTWQDLMLP